jgi:hypothetical protein
MQVYVHTTESSFCKPCKVPSLVREHRQRALNVIYCFDRDYSDSPQPSPRLRHVLRGLYLGGEPSDARSTWLLESYQARANR